MEAQPQPGVGLCAPDSLFRRNGFTLAPCKRVTETPWYVIRMPGVVGGVAPRGVPLSRLGVKLLQEIMDAIAGESPSR